MKRSLIVLILAAIAIPAGARADAPTVECGPLACASADTHLTLTCGADGRDAGACSGTVSLDAVITSPLPIGGGSYDHDVTCDHTCFSVVGGTGSCTWAGLSNEGGEPGCSMQEADPVVMMVPVPASGCTDASITSTLTVSHLVDPLAIATDTDTVTVQVCAGT